MDPALESPSPHVPAHRVVLLPLGGLVLGLLMGWLLLGGGFGRLQSLVGPSTAEPGEVGGPAPDFTLERAAEGQVHLADLRGRVVLVNFWATWCVPCRSEMPEIERVYQARRERGFEVLAVNLQEGASEIQPFMAELGLTFPALRDPDGAVGRLYRTRALPSSFLVDRQGVIRYVRVGRVTEADLEQQLGQLGVGG